MFSSADVFECKQGEKSTEAVNIFGLISFQNYNFKNYFHLSLASVSDLAPKMAPFVELWKQQKCWLTQLHSSYGKVPLSLTPGILLTASKIMMFFPL